MANLTLVDMLSRSAPVAKKKNWIKKAASQPKAANEVKAPTSGAEVSAAKARRSKLYTHPRSHPHG